MFCLILILCVGFLDCGRFVWLRVARLVWGLLLSGVLVWRFMFAWFVVGFWYFWYLVVGWGFVWACDLFSWGLLLVGCWFWFGRLRDVQFLYLVGLRLWAGVSFNRFAGDTTGLFVLIYAACAGAGCIV